MSSDNYHYLERINIENNIIIGTRIGIYYFPQYMGGTYKEVKIYFNTLWNIDYTPILFETPRYPYTSGNEMKNNFIDFAGAVEFEPKKAWKFAANYFYNTTTVPSIYYESYDNTSRAEKNVTLDSIFYKIKGCENYYNPNIMPECLRPSPNPGLMILYHSGNNIDYKTFDDFYLCRRDVRTPSIGAYEFPQECSDKIIPKNDTKNDTQKGYDVSFNITYCTSGNRVLKIIGSYCNWHPSECPTMTKNKKCNWSITFKNITSYNFKYKFAETIQNSIYKMESDPFRTFNGVYLNYLATKKAKGIYENCKYITSGNLITLLCTWK